MAAPFAALRHRDYRFYWLGTFAWIMGEFFRFLAQGWLVFDLTGDPFYLGLVSVLGAIPLIGLTPFTGVLADRLDRRLILMVSQTVTGSLMLAAAVLILGGWVTVWHIMVITLLAGIVQAVDEPARQAFVPQLVPREDLPSAISLGNGLWSVAQVAAPALAGGLIALAGPGPCYLATMAGFWSSVLFLSLVRRRGKPVRTAEQSARRDILQGLTFLRDNTAVRSLLLISLAIGAFGYAAFVLMPVFALEILDVGSVGYGILNGVIGVGGLTGTLWAARLAFSPRRGPLLLLAAGAVGLLLAGFGLSRSFPLSLGILLALGLFDGLYMNMALSVAQSVLPDELRGRIMGVWGITWFVPPLGGMAAGALARAFGAPLTVAVFGAMVAVLTIAVGLPGIRALAPSAAPEAPARTRPSVAG